MYVSFLVVFASIHPFYATSPGPGPSTWISTLASQRHRHVGLGHPALSSAQRPLPNTSLAGRLAGWLPVPSSAACPLLPAGTCWRPISATWRACGFALASVAVWSPAPRSPTDHGHGQRPPQQHQPETASAPVTHRTLLCLRTRDATPPSRQASAVSLHPFLLSDSCSLRCRLRPFDGR